MSFIFNAFNSYQAMKRAYPRAYILLECILVFMLAFYGFITFLLPLESLPIVDGFYHYRVAERIGTEGRLWYSIPWLPHTILGESGPDHHWFWHLLLAPITQLPFSEVIKLKLSIAYSAALVPAGLNLFLRLCGVPFAPVFSFLAIFSALILPGRFLMLKAQNIAVVFLCLYVYLLVKRKYFFGLVLAFVFMNSYHGAIILLPVSFIVFCSVCLFEKQFDIKLLVVGGLGIALALVINPWYPQSISYLLFHTVDKLFFPVDYLKTGDEWDALPFKVFISWNKVALGVVSLALISFILKYRKTKRAVTPLLASFFGVSAMFFCLSLFAGRFVEYWAPIAIILSALCFFYAFGESFKAQSLIALICIGVMFSTIQSNMQVVNRSLVGNPDAFEEIYGFLKSTAEKGDVIFTTGWGNLPLHVWQSPDYRYVNGLDPNYLASADFDKFQLWFSLRMNYYPDEWDLSELLSNYLDVRWVIASNKKFKSRLEKDEQFHLVFESSKGEALYHLIRPDLEP